MEIREKTIQVKVTESQKRQIEKFISNISEKDNIKYSISSYVLKIILEKMNDNLQNNK